MLFVDVRLAVRLAREVLGGDLLLGRALLVVPVAHLQVDYRKCSQKCS